LFVPPFYFFFCKKSKSLDLTGGPAALGKVAPLPRGAEVPRPLAAAVVEVVAELVVGLEVGLPIVVVVPEVTTVTGGPR
jgi:hypothetical protein